MVRSHKIPHVHLQKPAPAWSINRRRRHRLGPQQITKLGFVFLKLSILPVALRDLKLGSQRPLQELLSSSVSPCRTHPNPFQPLPHLRERILPLKPDVLPFLHVLRDAIT